MTEHEKTVETILLSAYSKSGGEYLTLSEIRGLVGNEAYVEIERFGGIVYTLLKKYGDFYSQTLGCEPQNKVFILNENGISFSSNGCYSGEYERNKEWKRLERKNQILNALFFVSGYITCKLIDTLWPLLLDML
ncbi:MAG: hypothetical protein LBQ73_06725 [Tannerellaceae bacterium]|jgi:hypothetical protein|nr:hypothetical protein [Tannerellaceae bacterium]